MKVRVPLFGQTAEADLAFPHDLSRPVRFSGEGQLQAFGLPAAHARKVEGDGYVLDVARGGSVNCSTLQLSPHGNGTHTECVGHVVEDDVSVNALVPLVPLVAWVFTIDCLPLAKVGEDYRGKGAPEDLVISAQALHQAAQDAEDFLEGQTDLDAIILRTGYPEREGDGQLPPYATDDAVEWMRDHGIHHVVLDTPSLDRLDDGGVLSAHRAFFGLELGQKTLGDHKPRRTITELCAVPDDVDDGPALLLLEVAPLESDAAPSRPVLFPLEFLP